MRFILTFSILTLFVGSAFAQDNAANKTSTARDISSSKFVSLTTWEKLKLGGAYYTSPEVIDSAPIAYVFYPRQFDDALATDLKALERNKEVVCGRYDFNSKTIDVVTCPSGLAATGQSVSIISNNPKLLGKNAEDVVKKGD